MFFLLNILKTKKSFVLSAMELPFVDGNGVVKMSKIRVRFLWYYICFKSMRRWLMIYMMIAYVIYDVCLCHI